MQLTNSLNDPPALRLAKELAVILRGLNWGIGGSLLLHRLGIEPSPKDLDVVVTPNHWDELTFRLKNKLGQPFRPHSDEFASSHFHRYENSGLSSLDVMAGIRVRDANGCMVSWEFVPTHITCDADLRWMLAKDWLEIYRLFGRHERVRQLESYFADPKSYHN